MQRKDYHPVRLSECRELTPKPSGVGEWAEKLRQAAFNAVKEKDITELMTSLLERAKKGDMQAAKFVLDYLTRGSGHKPQTVVAIQADVDITPDRRNYKSAAEIEFEESRAITEELMEVDREISKRRNGVHK